MGFDFSDILLSEAKAGNTEAMVDWAVWRCVNNSDKPLSPEEVDMVLDFYRKGIEDGNVVAMVNLGAMYYTGEYVERDYAKAIELYKRAAEYGDSQAMCNLGYAFYYGRGVDIDYKMAYECFTKAAMTDDNCNAYFKTGDMYMNGEFVEQDEYAAFALYEKAFEIIDKDDPNIFQADIYMRLGECYLYGKGCDEDAIEALRCLTQSECFFFRKKKKNISFDEDSLVKVQRQIVIAHEKIGTLNPNVN